MSKQVAMYDLDQFLMKSTCFLGAYAGVDSVIQVLVILRGLTQSNWTYFPLFFFYDAPPSIQKALSLQSDWWEVWVYKLWGHMYHQHSY